VISPSAEISHGNQLMTQLLVSADDVNILGGDVHSIKRNAEDVVIASKETGLEVNAEKTKYMVMSRNQNAGHNHNIKIDR
jgi:hypothetical protein